MTYDGGVYPSGSYTTPTQVRVVLAPDGNTADPSSAAGLDDATLLGPCQDAANEVDVRLGSRYAVPFTAPLPPVVVSIATDIAAYLATLVYRKGMPVEATDPVALRYARAEKLLLDLSTGVASLLVTSDGPPIGEVVVSNPVAGPLFGPDDYDLFPTPGTGRLSADRWGYGGWYG